jgi:hypothetical protein
MIDRGHDCRSDLVTRARRQRLSHAENLALQAHLAGCATCQLSRRVLSDFGEMNAVDHHDGPRVERLSAVARRWTQGRAQPRYRRRGTRRIRFLAFAGGLALLAGTASAAIWLRHKPAPIDAAPDAALEPATRGPSRRAVATVGAIGGVRSGAASAAPSILELPTPVLEPPAPTFVPPRHREIRTATEGARSAPALLLRRAGDAQRNGEPETALALYRRLRRDHAASPEATLATVPLGRLLLDRAPRAALLEFDSYLRASPAGALVPEALYGRARALGALGDGAQERQTWEKLLGRFPDSAYAPVGRRRLAELR